MPTLQFKGRVFVENHHLAVPYHEWRPIRSKGLSGKASLHDNLIIEGDNLAALKALLPTHHRKIKCIYIDPPYNTGNEGWAYNDNVNSPLMQDWLGKVVDRDDLTRHDKWCCMMLPRLKLLCGSCCGTTARSLSPAMTTRCIASDVSWMKCSGKKTLWPRLFGRKSTRQRAVQSIFRENHDFILVYARNKEEFNLGLLPRTVEADARYANPDNDPRGDWKSSDLSARNPYSRGTYAIDCPGGREIQGPPPGRFWIYSEEKFWELDKDNRIWWGEDRNQVPAIKRFLSEVKQGLVPETIWTYKEVGHTQKAKKTLLEVFADELPDFTSKPVELLSRIIGLSTDKDSIILDSFAGSGTTAHAVLALNKEHGGNRRFVLVECEDYVDSITAERVRRVIRGVPSAKNADLKAGLGGTFSYFKLGEPMRQESLLDGSHLPEYEALASYVFFTATGEEFEPEQMKRDQWFIGRSRLYDVYLIYENDIEKLKNMALTLDVARKLPGVQRSKLVFAPTKYLDSEFLHRFRITFQQLPFQIYETFDKLTAKGPDN